jgi:hypothetical protein
MAHGLSVLCLVVLGRERDRKENNGRLEDNAMQIKASRFHSFPLACGSYPARQPRVEQSARAGGRAFFLCGKKRKVDAKHERENVIRVSSDLLIMW